ncbi:glutathione S-transferase family protein [Agrobacterium rubi]|uniref:Glutathione S-transferase n=1 Tax=Agrobacterium rubi TaxID=28099 RepID=A0AAE7R4L4_9HYPH|nr:glutathione S-transferase N-terminal domain-containing protein [Agrobacterium rubi]NTE85760.1 glutathione S-transferase [Agrobacterium rubi]NTF01692.1 glutathione S-transferase [Agrobacterium rubi]NTF35935.1 glutathione S-transferase [Agrobacterium rubi]OCJ53250.1 hypothetical protein A6U92_25170 [Agrobacterium rubi]QTG01034.1 glutathione S-transferase [Agrobacterium rubi]
MTYTLYASPGSCSLAPHIVLEDIGSPYHVMYVSTDKGETKTAEFREVNPKGRVPVLAESGFILTEAPAILLHLAQTSPSQSLLQLDGDDLVRSVEWFNWLSGTVHAIAVRMIWRPEYFSDDPPQHPAIVEKGRQHLLEAFSLVEMKMGARKWAVGDRYTVVDPYLLVFYRWGNRMLIDMQHAFPAWTTHAKRLAERKPVQDALSQENISLWA